MEKYKLDIYKKETGKVLSDIKTLDSLNARKVIDKIVNLIQANTTAENFFQSVKAHMLFKDFDEQYTYSIDHILKEFDLNLSGDTFLVWDQKEVDQTSTVSLIENWKYIWYGVSDDAVIIFQNDRNLLLITHFGRIYYLR